MVATDNDKETGTTQKQQKLEDGKLVQKGISSSENSFSQVQKPKTDIIKDVAKVNDDEDDFLYGDNPDNNNNTNTSNKRELEIGEKDKQEGHSKNRKLEDHAIESDNIKQKNEDIENHKNISNMKNKDTDDSDNDINDDDGYSSDSSVEFIISAGQVNFELDSNNPSTTTNMKPLNTPLPTKAEVPDNVSASFPEKTLPLDIDEKGKLGDEYIEDVDPEIIKEKPWREPGINLSDYFNYGFNEFTWMEYLHRQEKLRAEYDPQKILNGLLNSQRQQQQQQQQQQPNAINSNTATNGNYNMPFFNNSSLYSAISNYDNQRNQQLKYQQQQNIYENGLNNINSSATTTLDTTSKNMIKTNSFNDKVNSPLPSHTNITNNSNNVNNGINNTGTTLNAHSSSPISANNANLNINHSNTPTFPLPPMFGGFPPFPFGMPPMPVLNQNNINNNNRNNSPFNNSNTNNKK
ncbi:uncharacterized protein SCODWIG_02786 [Saccharomycodes ludwigii]|uniref:Pre-mRNA polyadenylation factor FIP1 n=1 Tax=Saccharomycodes ludwigii TaxID=36035 RepID=A0A376B8N1_9ASCO|nr:hypothetical protein SCDLUD_000097 [Saccharomycodes ludwigii]KAH3902519.1 hypothetical protein SCDLUD_000097 [Saccharomycodes ludwigii]SSD61025.1 uncharacterized protein SCODWIG_02786 [Saccharomycodes ludwigii]